MGERSDDLTPRNAGYEPPYDRDQEIASRNEELMRERLSSNPPVGNTYGAGGDDADVTVVTDTAYIVGDTENPDPGGATGYASDMGDMDDTGDESATEIRGDIEDTRSRMGSTIDAIQEKLSPQNLMEQAKEAAHDATIGRAQEMASNVADSARETGATFMDTLRQNPVPVALTALGLGWLFVSARREAAHHQRQSDYWGNRNGGYDRYGRYNDRYRGGYDPYQQSQQGSSMSQMTDRVQDAASRVSNQAQDAASNVSDRVQDAAGNVADKAGDMADYAQWQAQRTRGWLEQTWNDNPLLVAGAALALGTVVGLSIPETQMENQLMGDARDNLMQKAQNVAQDTVQKARSAATTATDQVKQQAQQQQTQAANQQANMGKSSSTTH